MQIGNDAEVKSLPENFQTSKKNIFSSLRNQISTSVKEALSLRCKGLQSVIEALNYDACQLKDLHERHLDNFHVSSLTLYSEISLDETAIM